MQDLRQLNWMLFQWKRFRRMVWLATGAIWMVCCSGILLLSLEDLIVRLALLLMLVLCTVTALVLLIIARRERKRLDRLTIEIRAAQQLEKAQQAAAARN